MAEGNINESVGTAEPVKPDYDAIVQRLAALKPLEYDLVREVEAANLDVRVSTLDAEVKRARKGNGESGQGSKILFEDRDPWPEPVDGDDLLDQIATAARRYLILPSGGAELIALWVLHAHAVNAFYHTPRLAVTAPERRCGKSVVLDFLELLTPRALKTENVTTAVIFRLTEEHQPTVLCDEVDTYINSRDELVGILNSGHKRNAKAFRCEGDSNTVRGFNVFAPVATAGIGKLPPTLGDRSIPLRMRRARKDERLLPLRSDRATVEHELMAKAIRWAADHFNALSGMDPEIPDWMFNRVADNWRPLFMIAEAAGGAWPTRARDVAHLLSKETVSNESIRIMALEDLRGLFEERAAEYLLSEDVVEAFKKLEERPWADWKAKNGFTVNQLARMLGEFDLRPKAIKAANSRRGYKKAECDDVFTQYLQHPPFQTATPLPPKDSAGYSDFQTATKSDEVAVCNPRKPAETLEGSGVAVCNGGTGDTYTNDTGNVAAESDDPFGIPAAFDRRTGANGPINDDDLTDADYEAAEREAIMREEEIGDGP